jgi:hypothetical protein
VASVNSPIQTYWAASLGGIYSVPLAWTVGIVAVVIGVLVGFGREGRDVRMGREQLAAEVPAE